MHANVSRHRLHPKHLRAVRMAFAGISYTEIARLLNVRRETIGRVLGSPLARAELARLHEEAVQFLIDVPRRVWLSRQLSRVEKPRLKPWEQALAAETAALTPSHEKRINASNQV